MYKLIREDYDHFLSLAESYVKTRNIDDYQLFLSILYSLRDEFYKSFIDSLNQVDLEVITVSKARYEAFTEFHDNAIGSDYDDSYDWLAFLKSYDYNQLGLPNQLSLGI